MITPADADEMTQTWWDATREGRLLIQTCDACGHHQHPPRAVCTGCGSTQHLTHVEANGAAVVDAVTVVHRAPAGGFEPPYAVARVRLAEGPVLLTNTPVDVAIGDAVRLAWRDLPDGRRLPIFAPPNPEGENR